MLTEPSAVGRSIAVGRLALGFEDELVLCVLVGKNAWLAISTFDQLDPILAEPPLYGVARDPVPAGNPLHSFDLR